MHPLRRSFLLIAWLAPGAAVAQDAPLAPETPDQEKLDAQFESMLSGVTLVGRFTIDNRDDDPPKPERYRVEKVTKLAGETWLFQTTVQYGDREPVTVPLPLTVKWAGDTPVITLNKLSLPLLGTYSARVVFNEGRYAGTWSGADHGGALFGRIVPDEKQAPPEEAGEQDVDGEAGPNDN